MGTRLSASFSKHLFPARSLPRRRVGAFTATATEEVVRDIASQMPQGAQSHVAPMRRPNLAYQVSRWGDRDAVLLHDAALQQGQGLVYVQSRHDSERWSQRLQASGLAAASFHAGLPAKEKQRRQQRWMSGHLQVLACTSAFGMGIDAPHVRWVFHAGPPPTSNLTSKKQDGQAAMANPLRAFSTWKTATSACCRDASSVNSLR